MGKRGATAEMVKKAHLQIVGKLLERMKTIKQVITYLDGDGSGSLERGEIKQKLRSFGILEFKDTLTGKVKGDVSIKVMDTIFDLVDRVAELTGGVPSEQNEGKIAIGAFAKGLFTQDSMGYPVDVLTMLEQLEGQAVHGDGRLGTDDSNPYKCDQTHRPPRARPRSTAAPLTPPAPAPAPRPASDPRARPLAATRAPSSRRSTPPASRSGTRELLARGRVSGRAHGAGRHWRRHGR